MSIYIIGDFVIFTWEIIKRIPYMLKRINLLLVQIYTTGVSSLPIVLFTSMFIGIVSALQTNYQMEPGIPIYYLGGTSSKVIIIELAPVVISLVIAGRVGSYIASQTGTMKITEQLDALKTLGIDPIGFIFAPRVFGTIISLPFLVVIAEVIAVFSAAITSAFLLGVGFDIFFYGVKRLFVMKDFLGGIMKTFFFGIIIALWGGYYGYRTEYGAEGVGKSTTKAVVMASSFILVFDFIIAYTIFK